MRLYENCEIFKNKIFNYISMFQFLYIKLEWQIIHDWEESWRIVKIK